MSKPVDIKDDRGQAMVEFALALPVLVFLLFAIVQFGIAFNNYVTLTDAVRAGGRQASVARFVADPVGSTTARVLASADGLDTSQVNVTVTAADGTSPPTWNHGDDVEVTATYPYSIDLLGIVVTSGTLSSSATEKVE